MRLIDPRSRYSRRTFLKGAASAGPAAAVAAGTGLSIADAWAEDGQALTALQLKTLVKMARDVYPHDMLGDVYYITAIKPWDKKAAGDAGIRSMLTEGVARLDGDARDRFKVAYVDVPWEADRVTLLNFGAVVLEGTRAEVVADPRTREVYFGG